MRKAGGAPENVARLLIFVTDKEEYTSRLRDIGSAYRQLMGKHFPAMTLVEVKSLLEHLAKVEIEATAVIPGNQKSEVRSQKPEVRSRESGVGSQKADAGITQN